MASPIAARELVSCPSIPSSSRSSLLDVEDTPGPMAASDLLRSSQTVTSPMRMTRSGFPPLPSFELALLPVLVGSLRSRTTERPSESLPTSNPSGLSSRKCFIFVILLTRPECIKSVHSWCTLLSSASALIRDAWPSQARKAEIKAWQRRPNWSVLPSSGIRNFLRSSLEEFTVSLADVVSPMEWSCCSTLLSRYCRAARCP
mmetsp:Transcript_102814/g.181156  ORF Transcript_102814/g.181156 Transcript_102814/m.181156 type:complete len:202 (+) Transcript_102814:845-1450(+)